MSAEGLPARRRHDSHNNELFTLTLGWKIGLMSALHQSGLTVYFPHTHTGSSTAVCKVTKAVTV